MSKPITRLAVDGDIVAYRVTNVHDKPESTVDEMYDTIDEFMNNLAFNSGVENMTVYLSDKSNFRYEVAVTQPYKGNRKDKPKPKFLKEAFEYLKVNYGAYVHPNMEADDCIASDMTSSDDVAHAGIDKDIKQIEGSHFDFVKISWDDISKCEAALRLHRQVLTGDSSDNIPGLFRVGEKKAKEIITNPSMARTDALGFYILHLPDDKRNPKDNLEDQQKYFLEQETLIKMITDLELPKNFIRIKIEGGLAHDYEEGDWE